MAKHKYSIFAALVLAIAILFVIASNKMDMMQSAILSGFVILCASFIAIDTQQTKRAKICSYAMLIAGAALMFSPMAFLS